MAQFIKSTGALVGVLKYLCSAACAVNLSQPICCHHDLSANPHEGRWLIKHSSSWLLTQISIMCDRCGPCKVMLPLLVKLQEEQSDIKVYKLNCNKKNKELGVKLNVKVAPTFQLYKNKNKVNFPDLETLKML